MAENSTKIEFHYIKSNHFKSFYVTGAIGGVGPNGLLNMAFYVERIPIPQKIVQELSPEGKLGDEILAKEGKTGIIREIDCNLICDLATAKDLRAWLDRNIKILEGLKTQKVNE